MTYFKLHKNQDELEKHIMFYGIFITLISLMLFLFLAYQ